MCQEPEGRPLRRNAPPRFDSWSLRSSCSAQSPSLFSPWKPHNSSSSENSLPFFFFYPSLHPRLAWIIIIFFKCLRHLSFHSNSPVQSSVLLCQQPGDHGCKATYLWSRCSCPGRSPTLRSPGFSSPDGPRILHTKTPVQVPHTEAYSCQWVISAESIMQLHK